MPYYIDTGIPAPPGAFPSMPTGVKRTRLELASAAAPLIDRWFDVALTDGLGVDVSNTVTRLMDCWDAYSTRLDLVSRWTRPLLTAGGNGAVCLNIDNTSTQYTTMGAEDRSSLKIFDPYDWSMMFVGRPVETNISYMTGYEVNAGTTATDYSPMSNFVGKSVTTNYDQAPQFTNNARNVSRATDYGREYNGADHIVVVGFDMITGVSLAQNGFMRYTNPADKNPLTDTRFQYFGISNVAASLNFNGLFYGGVTFRKNILREPYTTAHRGFVKAYGDAIGIAHAFVE